VSSVSAIRHPVLFLATSGTESSFQAYAHFALCEFFGASSRPFNPGKFPANEKIAIKFKHNMNTSITLTV
jgi:hypothetical protein